MCSGAFELTKLMIHVYVFSGTLRERDPNLGFDMQYFQFSDQEIEPSEAPVVESTEAQDQAR